MARETKRDKAQRYIAEERVHVLSANSHGIRLEVRGRERDPYIVAAGRDIHGRDITSCTCANGREFHPVRPRCAHVEIARLLRRTDAESAR
jgi:uncharacterized Zn finger protein